MGFLDSAPSLCDVINTTMVAALNEITPVQADEAFVSLASPESVLGLKGAVDTAENIEVSEEVAENARAIMMVTLDEYAEAA